jgi:hypothetical protein
MQRSSHRCRLYAVFRSQIKKQEEEQLKRGIALHEERITQMQSDPATSDETKGALIQLAENAILALKKDSLDQLKMYAKAREREMSLISVHPPPADQDIIRHRTVSMMVDTRKHILANVLDTMIALCAGC